LSPTQTLSNPDIPEDVKERVSLLLSGCGGQSVGSYSDSAGIEIIRRHVAEYISERDQIESDWQNIVLTTGASEGAKAILALINSTSTDGIPTGVMVPIPQYPLYSATLCELGMNLISYYLDEENQWALNINELKRALEDSKNVCKPKAIVVINPGNPTGSVLTRNNIEDIIRFANDNNLLIIADEVYQHNIWESNAKFFSFKKVMHDLGVKLELVSMMSASKGWFNYSIKIYLEFSIKTILMQTHYFR
jgi:alanine transaminase